MPDAIADMARLREAQQRVAWIEAHPAFSDWLKAALRSAIGRNPIEVVNDLEILGHVLRAWATAVMEVRPNGDGAAGAGDQDWINGNR